MNPGGLAERFRWQPQRSGRLRFEPGEGGRLVESCDESGPDGLGVGRVRVWEKASQRVFEPRARSFEPGQATVVEVRSREAAGG